jgi:hypothetical protein
MPMAWADCATTRKRHAEYAPAPFLPEGRLLCLNEADTRRHSLTLLGDRREIGSVERRDDSS